MTITTDRPITAVDRHPEGQLDAQAVRRRERDAARRAPHPAPTGRARTLALVSLLLASAMELIDVTITNVALPTIERSLGAGGAALQWVVAAYPLAFGISLIVGARLGDRFGRRRLFIVGLLGFTAASAACGLAPSAELLVGFRVLQGIAAAAMVPQVLASIQVMYPPSERGKAMGVFSALAGISAVVGQVLGAVLTESLGWRAIFLVNVPVGIIALAAALRFIPESYADRAPRIDRRSVVMLAISLLAILYPLTTGHELGWPLWSIALMAAGVLLLGRFVAGQRRAERAGSEPLVRTSLYQVRSFTGGSASIALLFAAMTGFFIATTIYLQAGLGWSVLKSGLVNLPFALVAAVTAGVGVTVLMPKIGRRGIAIGAVVLAAGFGLLAATVVVADPSTTFWVFIPGIGVVGAGFGLMIAPVGPLTLGQVDVRHAGAAAGQFNTTGQLANAIGAAALGTLFFQVAGASTSRVPSEMLGSAYGVLLVVVAVMALGIAVVSRVIPADAHHYADAEATH